MSESIYVNGEERENKRKKNIYIYTENRIESIHACLETLAMFVCRGFAQFFFYFIQLQLRHLRTIITHTQRCECVIRET